jgi:hypothetical protein
MAESKKDQKEVQSGPIREMKQKGQALGEPNNAKRSTPAKTIA